MDILQPANLLAWTLQAAAVVLVAWPLPRLLGMWEPRARMIYWRLVLLGCLLLPVLQPWTTGQLTLPAMSVDVVGADPGAPAPPSSLTEAVAVRAARLGRLTKIASRAGFEGLTAPPVGIADVLVAGALLRLAWLGLGVFTLTRLRRAARPLWPRPASVDRAAALAETDAEFLVSATASRPVTCGWAWPVVLVPRTFESFPEPEQTAIATHELLHVSRADWARNALDELVRAVLWFHPGVWFVIGQIQLAREQIVDRESVRRLGTRQPYLEALLRLARPAPRLVLTPASLFLKRGHLRQRVTLLVKEVSMSRARIAASLAVMAIVVFIGGRLAASAFPLQQAGARTPGVATAAATLAPTPPVTYKFGPVSVRQALDFVSQATGISVAYAPGVEAALDAKLEPFEANGSDVAAVMTRILAGAKLTFRVVGERAVVVTPSGGSAVRPGPTTGSERPGMAAPSAAPAAAPASPPSSGAAVESQPSNAGAPGLITKDAAVVRRWMPANPGVVGRAAVVATIDTDGIVRDAKPLDSYDPSVASAAVEAAKAWKFAAGGPEPRSALLGFNFTPTGTVGLSDEPPVKIGGQIPPPIKIRDVKPAYPQAAREAGLQGVQILEVSLAPSGDVIDARALRGQEPLILAAIDAVLQWKFTPWEGQDRRLMTVTVNFSLGPGGVPGGSLVRDPSAPQPAASAGGVPYGWPEEALRVGGNIRPPVRVRDVKPAYPQEARDAGVQGVVIFDVLVGPDGKVKDARILRSIPMLDKAAYDAVMQWEFTPTLVNGNPIPLIMTVTVNFTLQ